MNTDVLQGDYPVTQGYGPTTFTGEWAWNGGYFHTGIDFGGAIDDRLVCATRGGTVWGIGDPYGGPCAVTISTDDGHWIRYLHLKAASVVAGQRVEPYAVLGWVGSLGNSTGPHLHFEVRTDPGQGPQGSIDPTPYLYFKQEDVPMTPQEKADFDTLVAQVKDLVTWKNEVAGPNIVKINKALGREADELHADGFASQ